MQTSFLNIYNYLVQWLHANVLTWWTAAQWACGVVLFFLALYIWRRYSPRLTNWASKYVSGELLESVARTLIGICDLVTFILLAQIAVSVFDSTGASPKLLMAFSDLALAGIFIRLLTGMMPNKGLARVAAGVIWIIAALNVLGLLTPITDFLKDLSLSMGDSSISAYGVIKGILLAAIFLQAASILVQFATQRVDRVSGLSPSLKVLMTKTIKVGLFTAAVLLAMSSVGIDLTSLALLSSALGVGIGFGLKTIISNYVAGILLLMDNSIKPGDTIEVGGVFGVVREMHGRYASIKTRDGKEYLVPNEQLITGEVVNWTFSDTKVRLKIPVGIAYDSDVDKAMQLLEQAGTDASRVLRQPAPAARLTGFGDNAVDLQLRVWIKDAESGVANVRSEILLKIWNLFHENDIEFPFPQRDILLKPDSALTVTIDKDSGA